jgi:hypothetical protein
LLITDNTKKYNRGADYIERKLIKMYFGFILLLALGAIIDFHVELRRPNVEVESHKKTLMEVMVLCKLRPATFEVLFTGVIVLNFHFVGSSSPRVLAKNSFPQFSPIHELGKIQRETLNFTTLRAGDAEEREESGQSISRRSTWTRCS